MPILQRFISIINILNAKIAFLTSFLLLLITFFTTFEVFMRYVMDRPTIWTLELSMQFFAPLVMLGGAYTLQAGGHVAVDVLVEHFSPRKRAVLDLFTSVLFFIAMFVIIWKGWEIGWRSWTRGEALDTIWGAPLWTIKLWVPIGAFFMLLQGIVKFLSDLQVACPSLNILKSEE